MKVILTALAASMVLVTACNPVPNAPTPSSSNTGSNTGTDMGSNMGTSTGDMMAMAHDPDKAAVASVDRFQDSFATLFKRSGPAFDPANVSKVVPAPNAPIDMDKYFLVHSLGPNGEKITYYALDVVPDQPGEAWVFVDKSGKMIPDQLPVINTLPGDKGYNDFVRITEVMVPDDYVPNSLNSYDAVKAAMEAGMVTMQQTHRIANWAVVPKGTIATQPFNGQPVSGYRAWFKGQTASYLRFDDNLMMGSDGKVPTSPIIVIFNNGMDPSMGFKAEASGQTHNVVATLPGDPGYSSLWMHNFQGKPEGFDAVHDFASATANRGADLPGILVNCPVVGMPMAPEAMEKTFTVTLESPMDGFTPLSPGVYVVHHDGRPLFTAGAFDMGKGLESQAEDGSPDALAASTGGMIFNTPMGATEPGAAIPGHAFQLTFKAKPGDHLSFTTMYGQSNDLFYAPAMDTGIPLFNGNTPVTGDVTDQVTLWDTGTEVNQEPGVGPDQAPRQMAKNTGASEHVEVQPVADRNDGFTYKPSIRVTIEAK